MIPVTSCSGASQTTIEGTAMNAVAADAVTDDRVRPRASDAPAPWARRVLWVGGLTQCAFGAFWLARGSAAIGGIVGVALLVLSALFMVGLFTYARQSAGTAPRPSDNRQDKSIEIQITVATALEFAAAIILPLVVSKTGHADWTLPSIAITVGPLLLWLDYRVRIPRYRAVGWALTIGPLILVAAMSGKALVATTGLSAGLLLLATAFTGFRELSAAELEIRPASVASDPISEDATAMYDREVHVVFGAGQVGRTLATRLAERGLSVRVVSRTRPETLDDRIEWRAADVTVPGAAAAAAAGAAVIYQCLNAPYTDWEARFPSLQRAVIGAAEQTGALLVSLENLYGYGPTTGPMTEDLPLAATTVKGRTRALMTQELLDAAQAGRIRFAIGRASDFFGAGVTESSLGERVFANAVSGKPADFIGNPNLPHTYSYVPDIAAGLAILGTDERAIGGTWHLPGPETVSTKALLELVASELGRPVDVRVLPKLAVRALGLFNPTIRELIELTYEFDAPFVLDTTKFESTFGTAGTPLPDAIRATLAWYQQRESNLPATRTRSVQAELAPTQTNGRKTVAKRCGRGRVTALALIALLTLSLGYLHFSGVSESVSVPSGARAGQLTLKPCSYTTENGASAADCGTLVVPENRHDPKSRLIALPVIVIHAHSAHPGLPIFRLQGGPGITNMVFTDASRFTAKHDVVLVGYRGVDGSSRLDCPEVDSAMEHSRDLLSQQSYRAVAAAYRSCAQRLRSEGVDLAGYSIPEEVDDLEAARRALGYHQIDLVSESAGTRVAMIYAWRYPKSIHRSVMIGVNPPDNFLWDAKTTGEQIHRYAALCAQATSCRSRTPNLTTSLNSSIAHVPSHWLFLPIQKGDFKAAAFFGLMNETSAGGGPIAAPLTINSLLSADNGDASGAWFLSLMARLTFPSSFVWGDLAAIGESDATYAKHFYASGTNHGISAAGNNLIWAGGRLLDAWPANPDENEYTHVQNSKVPTLLIGGNLDFATPPENATRELLPHLKNGREVVLSNLGHADDFWPYEPAAGSRLINTYLNTGKVDTSLYTHNKVDFSPSSSQDQFAKIVLIALLGLAALTVLSLLWMTVRLRKQASFGRKRGAAVRSLYAVLLGLGGWCLGLLVVLTALPTVPLGDPALTVISVSLPVALAVYSGWLKRDTGPRTKLVGIGTVLIAALLGAWLGNHFPATPLPGALTGILAAVAATNLSLIVLEAVGRGDWPVTATVPSIASAAVEY
jgi:nucleoside-diphosphate-sugar epimerase/pimeloyl-ACP methyl ester carboxylesterase